MIYQMLLAAVAACASWFATAFVAGPVRRFFDLRAETIRQMVQFNNVQARFQESRLHPYCAPISLSISEEAEQRLKKAEEVFRDLGAQMRSFALNETWAMWFVRFRYEPLDASNALLRLANKIGTYGSERHLGFAQAQDALRFNLYSSPQSPTITFHAASSVDGAASSRSG